MAVKKSFVSKLKSEYNNMSSLYEAIVRPCRKVVINRMETSLCYKLFPISKLKEYWKLFKKKSKLSEIKIISVQ